MSITKHIVSKLKFLCAPSLDENLKLETFDHFLQEKTSISFDEESINFCQDLSNFLLNNEKTKLYSDLVALGFYLRKSNIEKIKNHYQYDDKIYMSRGLCFHITPNNITTLFLYSLVLSLLSGNKNIVRLGSKTSIEQELLLEAINHILTKEQYTKVKNRILIVRYEHDDEINTYLSSICDARITWGGDNSINKIRQYHLKAQALDISFNNKISWTLINSELFVKTIKDESGLDNLESIAITELLQRSNTLNRIINGFINDAFSFYQQGCSSPRVIIWLDNNPQHNNSAYQNIFYRALDEVLKKRPFDLQASQISARLMCASYQACKTANTKTKIKAHLSSDQSSYIRLEFENFNDIDYDFHQGNGLFFELKIKSIEDALAHSPYNLQSITTYGINKEEIKQAIYNTKSQGICRIVPIGHALDFNHIWDGYDLISQLTRIIKIDI